MNRREFIKNLAVATAGAASAAALGAETIQPPAKDQENHGRQKMKILVLTGSPRKKGNSATLANHFIKGAEEAGHTVERFDAAFKKVHPCIACNSCGMNGPCTSRMISNSCASTSSTRTAWCSPRRCTISEFHRSSKRSSTVSMRSMARSMCRKRPFC